MNIRSQPFKYSLPTLSGEILLEFDEFIKALVATPDANTSDFVRSYVLAQRPNAFRREPLLWEALRTYIAPLIATSPLEIGLVGSAQLGFSPSKKGKVFSKNSADSDLDFFVVNETLYNEIKREAIVFCSKNETSRYSIQATQISSTLKRNFIDTKDIPAVEQYPKNQNILNLASIVVQRLALNGYLLKNSHFRVYLNWNSLAAQLRISYSKIRTDAIQSKK